MGTYNVKVRFYVLTESLGNKLDLDSNEFMWLLLLCCQLSVKGFLSEYVLLAPDPLEKRWRNPL